LNWYCPVSASGPYFISPSRPKAAALPVPSMSVVGGMPTVRPADHSGVKR